MSSGPPIFGPWAFIRYLFNRGDTTDVDPARAALDREELRQLEYQSAGLAVPDKAAKHDEAVADDIAADEPVDVARDVAEVIDLGERHLP